jgi:D-glycerate 3-kinase
MNPDRLLTDFIAREDLPGHYRDDATRFFLPLAQRLQQQWLREQQHNRSAPLLIGVNGAQGTGKSTLAALLTQLLSAGGLTVANLSIDDFYLGKAARRRLAAEVHPLFASRGVPGTHDTQLLLDTLQQLREADARTGVALPRFAKAADDCLATDQWPVVHGPVQVIVLEGWFVGVAPQAESALSEPINALERNEDSNGAWRRAVNKALAEEYQQVFAELDCLLMLQAPSFEQVYEWRSLQEEKLRKRSPEGSTGIMSDCELERFIQHFERLTRHCLAQLPEQADRVYTLNRQHRVTGCRFQD